MCYVSCLTLSVCSDVQEKPAVRKEIKIHWADEPGKNPLHDGFATSIVFKPVGNVKFVSTLWRRRCGHDLADAV